MIQDSGCLVTNPGHMTYAKGFGLCNWETWSLRPRPVQVLELGLQVSAPLSPNSALLDQAFIGLTSALHKQTYLNI